MQKVLVVQTAFIGDVILATPLAQALHSIFPDCQVDYLVIPAAVNLLEKNPNIRNVIPYDKRQLQKGLRGGIEIVLKLRREGYDLTIVPHRSLRSAVLVWAAKISRRIGFNRSAGFFLFTDIITYTQKHEVDRNLDLLKPLGYKAKSITPRVYWNKNDEKHFEVLKQEAVNDGRIWCALAPGSVWTTKKWPSEKFAELAIKLITKFNAVIFLIGGDADGELCTSIQASVGKFCVNTAGMLSLSQSAALLSHCRILVSNDSAPTHLGIASECQVLTIFGPTVPRQGFAPYGQDDNIIEKELSCRPCSSHGSNTCPLGTHACMQDIHVNDVLTKVERILKNERKTSLRMQDVT